MPFPPHYLLSYGGDFISDPGEVWSNNIRFAKDDNLDGATLQDLSQAEYSDVLTNLTTKITAMMTKVSSGYSANVRLKFVKLNLIGPDGLYADKSNSHTRFTAGAGIPGSGTPVGPISDALCITFLTDVERGRGSRGRIFIPHPDVALDTGTFRVPANVRTAIVNEWGTFLADLSSWATLPGPNQPKASVLSQLGTGLARNIRRVQVGDVMDYMGSRRNRLVETRTTGAILSYV